jgi:hypothetical protein
MKKRVLCVNSIKDYLVTNGRWYEVEEEIEEGYMIYHKEANFTFCFYKHLFITENEYRKQKLLKLNQIQ